LWEVAHSFLGIAAVALLPRNDRERGGIYRITLGGSWVQSRMVDGFRFGRVPASRYITLLVVPNDLCAAGIEKHGGSPERLAEVEMMGCLRCLVSAVAMGWDEMRRAIVPLDDRR
jgi:hypothetical protein